MANPGEPVIRRGATGDVVRRLQRALHRGLFATEVRVDGVFGPVTESEVRRFQQDNGLVVDGVVGAATWNALPTGAPMPLLHQGSRGAAVASLQAVLARLASEASWSLPSPGSADGIFGSMTVASVKGYQTKQHLAADGVVGDDTWATDIDLAEPFDVAVGLQFVTS